MATKGSSGRGPPDDLSGGLRAAAEQSDLEALGNLLGEWKKRLASERLPPDDLQFILRWAVTANQRDSAALLMDEGSTFSEDTLYHSFFFAQPPLDVFQLFLQRGWDINKISKMTTMTLLMCVTTSPELVKWCLAHGSDPNIQEPHRWTTLDWAAAGSSAEVLRLLVEHGGDLSRSNALHAAAAADPEEETDPAARKEVIACLLREYGMDINALSTWDDGPPRGGRNVSGTPLHRAIQVGNRSTAEFLLQNGADRNVANVLGSSCSAYAEEYGSNEIKELLRLPN